MILDFFKKVYVLFNNKNNKLNNELDGLVWISNGRVFVKNEIMNGMPPLINPCEGVKLFINGLQCNHITTVSEKDVVELKAHDFELAAEMKTEISEDRLKAFLNYVPSKIVKNIIVDSYPVNKLDIEVTQLTLETKSVTAEQIKEFLKRSDIEYGINDNIIDELCDKNTAGQYLVAEGIAPVEPSDDIIEYNFNKDNDTIEYKPKVNETGNIDFKNISFYQMVSSGQVIANLKKGTPGINGITVTGKPILFGKAREITILPSFSTKYDDKTGNIIATKSGRPAIQEKGDSVTFLIYDIIIIDEVNMMTGNVHFKGNIEIKTNVSESMEVVAKRDVLIKGNVDFASIYAGNNITIKGTVITSKINAAMSDIIAKDPAPLLQKLTEGIEELIKNIKEVSARGINLDQNNSFSDLVRYLFNGKNKHLPMLVYEVMNSLRKENYDIENEFILSLLKSTRSLMGNFSELSDLKSLSKIVSDINILASDNNTTAVKGNVTLNSVVNCDIAALGNIQVLGKGCVNTKMTCGGKAVITGYIRGGRVQAEKGIEINTAGSERGSKILLAVPENSYIQIRSVYTDTVIKVGGISYTFLSEKRMVRARIENGKLVF